jgi:hypothetical protein
MTDQTRSFKAAIFVSCISLHSQVMVSDLPLAAGFTLSLVFAGLAMLLLIDLTKPPRA